MTAATRRTVLAALAAGFPVVACAGPIDAIASLFTGEKTFDVIVVGAGAAGLAAAVEAADAGASVVVLEKQAEIGGNTLISGGFYAAVDPGRQHRQHIADSIDLFYRQTFEKGNREADPALVRHMVEGATEGLVWLEGLGMRFRPEVFELYGSHWPRSHSPVLPLGRGYIRTLSAAALSRKVVIEVSSPVTDILFADGRAAGVRVGTGKGSKVYRARKGVVLAAGSFAANPRLVARYAPQLAGLTTNNTPASTGEVMVAAHNHGVALVGMRHIQCLPGCPPGKRFRVRFHNDVSRFILVNHEGRRFTREDGARSDLRDAVLALPNRYAFMVIDDAGFRAAGILVQKEAVLAVEGGEAWKANSLAELAAKIGVPAANLESAVADYNRGIDQGRDPFGKAIHPLTTKIAKPPFWACYAGMTLHYTEGGLAINERAQCLDGQGKPVPGLFAAGTITGGVHGANRLGANGLADAIVFGRTAGKNAAR